MSDESTWPPDQVLRDEEVVRTKCGACGRAWRVHDSLAGHKLRCRCGEWLAVPASTLTPALRSPATPTERLLDSSADFATERELSLPRPLSPEQRRPPILELVGLAVAFLGPPLLLQCFVSPDRLPIYLPLSGAATSVLVLLVGLPSRADMFAGLRRAAPVYWLEALCATAIGLGFALAYSRVVEHTLHANGVDELVKIRQMVGPTMALFTVALVPALFEELAFRGLVQGRLARQLGTAQALAITASIFGLAHGVTPFLPIHAGLGFYLCWLRGRSQSLLPGMLVHLLYNGTLVLIG